MGLFRKACKVAGPLTIAALLLGSLLISAASRVYLRTDELPPFAIEKLPLPRLGLWLFALRVHVAAAALALPACLALLSRTLLKRAPRVHRWLGRVTGMVILLGLLPSGFYLSLFAKGGRAATLGFMLSGAIVVLATLEGVRTARARLYGAHRRWMLHVLAQLSVAVTSRALLVGLDMANVDPERAYLVALFVPVIASALVVEAMVHSGSLFTLWRNHETPSRLRRALHRRLRVGDAV
jgi:hypothetical protein